jgi:acetamidase/formamidase
MAVHTLGLRKENLHGFFSRERDPVLTVRSGDTVRFQTLDTAWGMLENPDPFSPPPKFPDRNPREHPGHALCGPVAVEGAEAGMTLEVRLEARAAASRAPSSPPRSPEVRSGAGQGRRPP